MCGGVVQHTCLMHVICLTLRKWVWWSVQHACHMPDFKKVKMVAVGDYLNFNMYSKVKQTIMPALTQCKLLTGWFILMMTIVCRVCQLRGFLLLSRVSLRP